MLESDMTLQDYPSQRICGVILAGGLGRRMGGQEKSLIELAGRPLAGHVAERLSPQLLPGRLLLNTNGPALLFAGLGLPVVGDDIAGRPGPLAGILATMRIAGHPAEATDWVLSAPTDTPFLPRDLVARLITAAAKDQADIVLAASANGLCQVCGLWSIRLAGDLAVALASGHNKVFDFARAHRWSRVEFPPEQIGTVAVDPFFNVNTPGDLAQAAAVLQSIPK